MADLPPTPAEIEAICGATDIDWSQRSEELRTAVRAGWMGMLRFSAQMQSDLRVYRAGVAAGAEENANLRASLSQETADRQCFEHAHEKMTEHACDLERERDEARDWVRRLTASTRVLTCAFCGEAYPPGTPESNHEALTAHVLVCAKHPMRAVEAERDRLVAKVEQLSNPALLRNLEQWDILPGGTYEPAFLIRMGRISAELGRLQAEVEKLHEAHRNGAEAMRERAANEAECCSGGDATISKRDLIAQRIRALPLPDTKKGER